MRTPSNGVRARVELLSYFKDLRRYAMALVGNPSEADDLVQECMYRVLSRDVDWRKVRNPRAYLLTILRNIRHDNLAKRSREGWHVQIDEVAQYLPSPPTQLVRMQQREMIKALRELPEPQREVLLLIGLEEMSYRETAEILDIPIGTVMSRLSRGREALRRISGGAEITNLRQAK